MRLLPLLLALMTVNCVASERAMDQSELVDLVLQSLSSDRDDSQLADRLARVQLSERLSPDTLGELERLGLGPLALQRLQDLEERSHGLRPPALPPITREPAPSAIDREQMRQRLNQYANAYVRSLPDFLCDEITDRYSNLHGLAPSGNARYSKHLHHADTLRAELAFAPRLQQDRLQLAWNAESLRSKQGQSLTRGEFGRDMAIILGSHAEPELKWDRWERHDRREDAVFVYFVPQARSDYNLFFCCFLQPGVGEMQQSYRAAIRGEIYADPWTGEIQRLVIRAVDMPAHFHVSEDNTIISYGQVSFEGRTYNLPVSAMVFVRARMQRNRNEIRFVNYRKFDSDSVITDVHSKITYIQ
jgi:hypothetical protein